MKTGVPSLGSVSLNRVLSEDGSSLSGFGVTKQGFELRQELPLWVGYY